MSEEDEYVNLDGIKRPRDETKYPKGIRLNPMGDLPNLHPEMIQEHPFSKFNMPGAWFCWKTGCDLNGHMVEGEMVIIWNDEKDVPHHGDTRECEACGNLCRFSPIAVFLEYTSRLGIELLRTRMQWHQTRLRRKGPGVAEVLVLANLGKESALRAGTYPGRVLDSDGRVIDSVHPLHKEPEE